MLEGSTSKRTTKSNTDLYRELGEISATLLYIQSDIKDIKASMKEVDTLHNFKSYVKGAIAILSVLFVAAVSYVFRTL